MARILPTESAAPSELNHVVLRSAHVADGAAFYEHLLGMKRMAGDGKMAAAMSQDGEHHRVLLINVSEADRSAGPGLEHMAFKVRTVGELLGNYKRCKDLGIVPFMSVHHGGTLSAYYLDPDGVQIEVLVDTQPTDVSIEMMHSPQFAENPIGVPVDFDDLCERYEAGEPIESLYAQPPLQDGDLEQLIQKVVAARGAPLSR
jgi:catechol-2,3-dioxygenase